MNFYHGLLLLAFCGLGLLVAMFIRNTKLMFVESTRDSRKLDFENDIVFVDFMIENMIIQEITKMEIKKYTFSNKILKTLKAEISMCVYKSLSNKYKDIMYTYFSRDGFNEYIINKVDSTIQSYALRKGIQIQDNQ